MSHFSVLVIGDNIKEQLEPLQELDLKQEEAKLDPRAKFKDTTDESLEEYNNKSVEKIVMPDGRLLDTWDEEFKVGAKTEIPSNLERRNIPYKELFSTFKEYMKEWCNEKEDEDGRYGYYYNPNAKWDWWQIGGRWTGFFKLKNNDVLHLIGKPGVMTEKAKEGYADSTLKRDIDFVYMRNKYTEERAREYDLVMSIVGDSMKNYITWESLQNKDNGGKLYNNQEAVKKIKVASKENNDLVFINLDDYNHSRDKHIKKAKDRAITTFAVIKDGKWYEKGEMGWWGITINKKDQDEWNKEFNELLDSLPDDIRLTIVDCHI